MFVTRWPPNSSAPAFPTGHHKLALAIAPGRTMGAIWLGNIAGRGKIAGAIVLQGEEVMDGQSVLSHTVEIARA